jgi:DnaD/phage-associated family protein
MMIKFDFEKGSAAFPAAAAERVGRASDTALRLLIILAAEKECREDYEGHAAYLTGKLKCTRKELDMALGFWCGAGVMDIVSPKSGVESAEQPEEAGKAETVQIQESPSEKPEKTAEDKKTADKDAGAEESGTPGKKSARLMRAAGVPEYTSEELADMLEKDMGALGFVDEAQRRIGRMLNTREISILIGLRAYLELEDEYIFVLLDYCSRIGKTSMRYVETVAFGMYDDGVTDTDALAAALAEREAYGELEGKFKKMIGAGGRRLTAKESRFLNRWSVEMKYDFKMLELAYEITVDTIHEYSPAYMNTILERWYASAITTPEQVEVERAKRKATGDFGGGSFDTNEFFEAALKRSFSDSDT